MTPRRSCTSWLAALALAASLASPASAFPGAFVGKSETPNATSTHVVLMRKGDTSVVTVMPDYQGAIEPFVLVMPVPGDVTLDRVRTLKREVVDRLDRLTAPKFHEFWEMDACEAGKPEQEWQRDLTVTSSTPSMLGTAEQPGATRKVAREMLMKFEPEYKDGEYTFSLLSGAEAEGLGAVLEKHGVKPSTELLAAASAYVKAGMRLLIAKVDPNRIELVGGDRAQLSPIRYYTEQPLSTLPVTFGLNSFGKAQELFIYVLDPSSRWEAKNYPTAFAPTNVEVDFKVKERMGEFFAALHDIFLKKHPGTFLTEYAWPTEGCGEPCQDERLLPSELLSLGVDVFEAKVPEAERTPAVPEMTAEEKKAFDASLTELKPAEREKARKAEKLDRIETARRRALLERNRFILTRLHYRYDDKAQLATDVTLGPAEGVFEGGVSLPTGVKKELSTGAQPASQPRFQTRFNNFHESKVVPHCDNPERGRWGKAPRDYRGLRKIWVADDIARKSRTQIVPAEVLYTAIPDLDLAAVTPGADAGSSGAAAPSASASAAPVDGAAPGAAGAKSGCDGCSLATAPDARGGLLATALGLALAMLRRRRP